MYFTGWVYVIQRDVVHQRSIPTILIIMISETSPLLKIRKQTSKQKRSYLLGLLALGIVATLVRLYPPIPRSEGWNAAVATENAICSDIGIDILKQGGSAADSAIATTICVGTVNMYSSGIGGGGFALLRDKNGTKEFVNFRETAPESSDKDMFQDAPHDAQLGGRAIGVP